MFVAAGAECYVEGPATGFDLDRTRSGTLTAELHGDCAADGELLGTASAVVHLTWVGGRRAAKDQFVSGACRVRIVEYAATATGSITWSVPDLGIHSQASSVDPERVNVALQHDRCRAG
jgi:hypothetical protein